MMITKNYNKKKIMILNIYYYFSKNARQKNKSC
jgi:hypothetical protein